ncbi:MAG: DNA polymerase III subunit beta [Candidatus Nomurabacteria bacterium]|jgi:DNA polymerase-3 subunit beta|nr:DNA polymerase III subunit beta [Candidatus Nomurabacteria bacterium]
MKLEVSQEKLTRALNIVSRVASAKTELPILNNVLFRTDGSSLVLSATNLEVAVVDYISAKIDNPGTITVPAKLLTEFISNLPKSDVSLEVKGGHLHIQSGNYRSTINGIDSEEFPELPVIDEKKAVIFKISTSDFKESVAQVIASSSNDTTRPSLTGVYFNTFEGNLYLAATDGYRLSEKMFIKDVKSEIAAIIPTSSLQEVLRSINEDTEEIEVLFDENQVKFRLGEIEVTSKIIDGSFPDYRQLIPKKTDIELSLGKEEFLRVTKLAGLFALESGGSIVLEAIKKDGILSISSVASELGENHSNIETKVNADGKITLNSRFLVDGLNNLTEEETSFGFSGKLAPCVLKNKSSSDYVHIIMPLKS